MVSDSRPCTCTAVLAALDKDGIRYEVVSAEVDPAAE